MSLATKILDRVQKTSGPYVWTPKDFVDLGTRTAVDTTLHRLSDGQQLTRIDHGLYYRPRKNSLTGRSDPPDHMAVIEAVARRDGARMLVDGMTAANNLGFTTAVPGGVTVLTDARLKPISLGNLTINFRQAAPSRLVWAGRPAAQLVQALIWLRDLIAIDAPGVSNRLDQILAHGTHGNAIAKDLSVGLAQLPIWLVPKVKTALASALMKDVADPSMPQMAP